MKFIQKVNKSEAALPAEKEANLETIVKNMIKDTRFNQAIHEMIDASKTAINFAHLNHNANMLKFNTLCLNFFHAIQLKDEHAAIEAAQNLVKAGHGKAFGLI